MDKIAVYTFQTRDRATGRTIVAPRMATPDAIRREKGMADLESKLLVVAADIDPQGFYTPKVG